MSRILLQPTMRRIGKSRRAFTLPELIISIAVMAIAGFAIIGSVVQAEQTGILNERRAAVCAELTRQLAQARSLPLRTLLNGGVVPTCQPTADFSNASFVGVAENFFNGVTLGTWITRNATANLLYAVTGTSAKAQTVEVKWKMEQRTMPTSKEVYYEITVLVKLDDGLRAGDPMVFLGKVLRSFEPETRT